MHVLYTADYMSTAQTRDPPIIANKFSITCEKYAVMVIVILRATAAAGCRKQYRYLTQKMLRRPGRLAVDTKHHSHWAILLKKMFSHPVGIFGFSCCRRSL